MIDRDLLVRLLAQQGQQRLPQLPEQSMQMPDGMAQPIPPNQAQIDPNLLAILLKKGAIVQPGQEMVTPGIRG